MPIIEVSWGELFDRLSILELKAERVVDAELQTDILSETLKTLEQVRELSNLEAMAELRHDLKEVNTAIWELMEELWRPDQSDQDYARIARQVTELNLRRSFVKKELDEIAGSRIREVKSYFRSRP